MQKGRRKYIRVRKKMTKKKGKNELGKKNKNKKIKRRKGERHIPMNLASRGTFSSSSESEILFRDRFIVQVLKDVLRPPRRQVHIRSTCGRVGNGRRGNNR